ncbi:MAG: prenyltransferase, partial [Deltaproteobacteria bacterium]
MSRSRLTAWYQASRPPFFVATMIPLALGGVIAHSDGYWDTLRWLILLIASFFVHLSTNLVNDYCDYTSGADAGDSIG